MTPVSEIELWNEFVSENPPPLPDCSSEIMEEYLTRWNSYKSLGMQQSVGLNRETHPDEDTFVSGVQSEDEIKDAIDWTPYKNSDSSEEIFSDEDDYVEYFEDGDENIEYINVEDLISSEGIDTLHSTIMYDTDCLIACINNIHTALLDRLDSYPNDVFQSKSGDIQSIAKQVFGLHEKLYDALVEKIKMSSKLRDITSD